jgi:hypothetical protein
VPDFPAVANLVDANSRLYHPMVRSVMHPAILAVRVRVPRLQRSAIAFAK